MKKTDVEFKVEDEALRGSLFIPDGSGPFPGVVFYHGRGSTRKNYLPMAEDLGKKGIMALVFDFRGCGESDGEFKDKTNRMGIDDAKAGLQFLLGQDIDKKRIGIQGTSFGAYVTGMLLNDPQSQFIRSIVLRVPAALSDDQLDFSLSIEEEENFFAKKENWINTSAYNGFVQFKGSLLVIRSEKDQLLPEESVNKYYDVAVKAKERKLYVQKNAGHSLSDNTEARREFNRITVNWFLETL